MTNEAARSPDERSSRGTGNEPQRVMTFHTDPLTGIKNTDEIRTTGSKSYGAREKTISVCETVPQYDRGVNPEPDKKSQRPHEAKQGMVPMTRADQNQQAPHASPVRSIKPHADDQVKLFLKNCLFPNDLLMKPKPDFRESRLFSA